MESKKQASMLGSLAALIPGYGGYRSLESRREDDRLTREFVSRRIEECKSQLDRLGLQAATAGDLTAAAQLERIRGELDRARSRVAAAVEGYSGWFSARTVDEPLLQQIGQQDEKLISVVDWLDKVLTESPLAMEQLDSTVQLLHERIDRRGQLLKQA